MADTPRQFGFFCDESGTTRDRYLTVGGLAMSALGAKKIMAELDLLKVDVRIESEIKWEHVSKHTFHKYKPLVDYFFSINAADLIHFYCVIVDYKLFDHAIKNDGDKKKSLHKMYYQLILHRFGRYCGPHGNLHIRPDSSGSAHLLKPMRIMLNHDLRNRYGVMNNPVKTIEPRDSKKSILLQLNDLILGGVCAIRNKRFKDDGRPEKRAMAEYILDASPMFSFENNTPANGQRRFSVWNLASPLLKTPPAPRHIKANAS